MGIKSEQKGVYRKSDIRTMIHNNLWPVSPDIVEQVIHNPDSLVPY